MATIGPGITFLTSVGDVDIRRGTVTLNGATPVTVSDPLATADSVVIFTLKTAGGSVGAYPAIQTKTAGTGWTVAGTAGDTSVYDYIALF